MGLSVGTMIAGWDEKVLLFVCYYKCCSSDCWLCCLQVLLHVDSRGRACIMWTVKVDGLKGQDFLLDLDHHMLMVSLITGNLLALL